MFVKALTLGTAVAAIIAAGLLTLYVASAGAPSAVAAAETAQQGADVDEAAARLVSKLRALRPDIPIQRVTTTPLPGIYALEIGAGTVFYGTADGRFLFAGDLYELRDDELVNLAEEGREESRKQIMAAVPRKDMVIFSPAGEVKSSIAVFTDVDCGFCQRLHLEVPKLNEMGIEVRYLAYPRAGVGSPSYQKIVSAWCAPDPNLALTRVKAREEIPVAECPNPVADQLNLGREIGIAGTPAIVLEDGRMLPGYMPAEDLAAVIGL
jgi:thiol:disulfide interchange protein DsbC